MSFMRAQFHSSSGSPTVVTGDHTMPIFARRRLRAMIDDLSALLEPDKVKDLMSRLEHRDTASALAAEAELAMLWGISRVAHLEVDPSLPGSSKRPDALSTSLFSSSRAVVEVRALSDDSFSGKEMMERTANIISSFADQQRKGSGKLLFFTFQERSYWNRRFRRERCTDPNFQLTPRLKEKLRAWISADNWTAGDCIRITEGKTDVVVRRLQSPSPGHRIFCTMPAVAYDLEDNPIYKALKKKSAQVKGAGENTLRCVFLIDAGCGLLRSLRPLGGAWEVGGAEIIRHALRKLSIDSVCVFSPFRKKQLIFGYDSLGHESNLSWQVTCFDSREDILESEYSKIEKLATQLPAPRFEGYQARDRHRQGSFDPQGRGWYLATELTASQDGRMTIKISSRLVQEYLAGRMDAATFQQQAFGKDKNYFEMELARGNTFKDVRFEAAGNDEDDDRLIFDLDFDWGAAPLKSQNPAKT